MNEQTQKRLHGKTIVPSKYIPKFPESAERDYLRFMNQYVTKALKAELQASLPELIQILYEAEKDEPRANQKLTFDSKDKAKENAEERAMNRRDTLAIIAVKMESWFERLKNAFRNGLNIYFLRDQLNRIANANRKLTVKEWKKVIGKTLGINLLEDYFDGDFFSEAIEQWISDNVDLIVTIPNDALDHMKKVVYESYMSGKPVTAIVKDIQKSYGTTKSHARLIARDQIGKLNSQINRYQQQSCGVNQYQWRTAGDGRVRSGHKKLDKKIFSWDNPPIVDNRGRRCHPGEDYQCRCIAVPVLDLKKLDIPVDGTVQNKKRGN